MFQKKVFFTGLNNFKILSITDTRFDEHFGFTDEEVERFAGILSYGKQVCREQRNGMIG